MKKILPSQLTYEELMEVMNSQDDYIPPVEQITDYFNDIVPFLTNYGITPGETPVSKKLLYKHTRHTARTQLLTKSSRLR
jgi:hypothetical protein